MMTVRFETGLCVQYNTANFAQRSAAYTDIYESNGGRWIAQVPNGALIEVMTPCRVYNPLLEELAAAKRDAERATRALRVLRAKVTREAKACAASRKRR